MQSAALSQSAVVFDFDNTITAFNVFDDFIGRFAVDEGWKRAAKKLREGKIGSRECLEAQLGCVRVTRRRAEKYLDGVSVDMHFKKILSFLKERGAQALIVSDSFYFLIDRILKNSGIAGVKVLCSQARFHRDKIIPSFPDRGRTCFSCANCKKRHLLAFHRQSNPVIYAGSGIAGRCAAGTASMVFAKDELARRLKKELMPFLPFRTLADIYASLKKMERGSGQESREVSANFRPEGMA